VAATLAGCVPSAPSKPIVLFIGDSQAVNLADSIATVNTGWHIIDGGRGGCTISPEGTGGGGNTYRPPVMVDYNSAYWNPINHPLPSGCENWQKIFTDYANAYHPRVVVFMVGAWEVIDRWFPGECVPPNAACPQPASLATSQTARDHFLRALNKVIRIFSAVGSHVVLVQPPYFNSPVAQMTAQTSDSPAAVRIWYEPYGAENDPSHEAWNPDLVNGVKPDYHDSKTEIQALNQVEAQWVNSSTLNTELPKGSGRHIVEPGALVDLNALFSPGDAFTKYLCFGSGQVQAANVNGSTVTCPDPNDTPYQVRDNDGVHFTAQGALFAVNSALIPAIQASL